MGQFIMVGTMALLLVVILGLVYAFDPEARHSASSPNEAANEEPDA